ncbi:anthranilate phosphoribosyltransferase [Bacillus horti]|uniref:Anthranilate phosphoribosyltransferase n=1 Tax=Caldalkalibacillus horti TaxID=77523 RepID=A0ABT9VWV4_9BACI|nr:anthranilate phosphoribosyltransferase [Bacillus horti]MDQ0165475.1 anthranilate phosphoribosyltransferase [Bacillus horti]
MLKETLRKLMAHQRLGRGETYECMNLILAGVATPAQISSFISILSYRGVDTEELIGMIQSMRDHALPIYMDNTDPIVDTCGTGAGGVKTFNVSTASALVASASGLRVAKHGNRAVTSQTGSADVLQELDISVDLTPGEIKKALDQNNMCFMFAPIYHQAMKFAATTRKEIGFRSIFNLLGPLTNPAGAKQQVIGVFDPQYSLKMAEALHEMGSEHVLIVHGQDGLDECTMATETLVTELMDGQITSYSIAPESFGLERSSLHAIQAKSPQESAQIIREVISGKREDVAKDIICLNAGAALYVGEKAGSIGEGVQLAQKLVEEGHVLAHYQRLAQAQGEMKHAY